jgi:glutamine cyclotransferase
MDDVRNLVRQVNGVRAPDLWPEIEGRHPRTPQPDRAPVRRAVTAVVALVIGAGGVVLAYRAFDGRPPEPAAGTNANPRVTAEIPVDPDRWLMEISSAGGTTWVGSARSGLEDPTLIRIDHATNEIVASIPLRAPVWGAGLAATDDAVWVATPGYLDRIDPATNEIVASVPLPPGGPVAIAADEEGVWVGVLDETATVVRVDPGSNEIVAEIPVGDALTGNSDQIEIGAGAVWLLGPRLLDDGDPPVLREEPAVPGSERGGDLVRIDPSTNEVVATIPVEGLGMAVGGDVVWVSSTADGVLDSPDEQWIARRVDPATNEASPPIEGDLRGILAVTDEGIWLASYDRSAEGRDPVWIRRIDPATMDVDADGPRIEPYFHDAAFDGASRTIWVSGAESVFRVDLD